MNNDQRREIKRGLERLGYAGSTATALSKIDDAGARAKVRTVIADSGVKPGPGLAYFIALVAYGLKAGGYPSAPAALNGPDTRFITDRSDSALRHLKGAAG